MTADGKRCKEDLLLTVDRAVAAMKKVVDAYGAKRSPQRDIHWLALQTGKEYGAVVLHARRQIDTTPENLPGASCEELRKSLHDALEEIDHYEGYLELLNWSLNGRPCPVSDMYEYCPPPAYRLLGFGDYRQTLQRWPRNYAYFTERSAMCSASSDWGAALITACGEGGAVGWHWAQSGLPVCDEYSERLTHHERTVAEDELHHGPETFEALFRDLPSIEAYETARQHVKRVRMLEMWQRNEQYMHPLSDDELAAIEADFYAERLEPVDLFRTAAL